MDYFVIFFINQVFYEHEFVALVEQSFKDIGKCGGCVVGIVMKQNDTAVFHLACNAVTNALRRGGTQGTVLCVAEYYFFVGEGLKCPPVNL